MTSLLLFTTHVALGARMTDFAGWAMPRVSGSDVAEHHAVRRTAALFDLSHMGQIEVTGAHAAAVLDGDAGRLAVEDRRRTRSILDVVRRHWRHRRRRRRTA